MRLVLTYFWLRWVLLHIWLSFTIHYFIFHFQCSSILHFAVCQLLCWAFLLAHGNISTKCITTRSAFTFLRISFFSIASKSLNVSKSHFWQTFACRHMLYTFTAAVSWTEQCFSCCSLILYTNAVKLNGRKQHHFKQHQPHRQVLDYDFQGKFLL